MKKGLALVLFTLFCLLAACGNDDMAPSVSAGTADTADTVSTPSNTPPASSASGEEHQEDTSSASSTVATYIDGIGEYIVSAEHFFHVGGEDYEGVWETMKLIAVEQLPQGGQSLTAVGENGSLLTFAAPKAVACRAELEDGFSLRPGMTVQVGYDGAVLESYPGQITPEYLTAEEYDGGLISLYLDVLEELYGQDTGLNDGCRWFGFDLTGAPGLTPGEQQAIGWVFASSHGCEPLYGTIEELGEEGYIDMDALCWEDGLHYELKASEATEDSFTLGCTKWKSGLGAIGYKLTVEKKDGVWTMDETGESWAS